MNGSSERFNRFFARRLENQIRHFIATGSVIALYAGGILAGTCLGVQIASLFSHEHPGLAAAFVLLAALGGFVIGSCLAFGAGAFWMKVTHRAQKADHPLVSEVFGSLPHLRAYVIPASTDSFSAKNVVVAGFRGGTGFFSPGVFISEEILKICSASELKAILCHERAHLEAGHLASRMKKILLSFFASAFFTTLAIVGLEILGFKNFAQSLCIVAGAIPVGITYLSYRSQIRAHEIEADRMAVNRFHARADDLTSALRKVSDPQTLKRSALLHERLALLEAMAGDPIGSTIATAPESLAA